MSSTTTTAATPAQQPDSAAASPAEAARALRHKRARKLLLELVGWVLLPTLVAAIYLGLIASKQYESVASLALRGQDAAIDAAMLREYVGSRDALRALNAGGKLRSHYEKGGDPFSRLASGGGDETLFQYYRGKVDTGYDSHSGVLTLRVRAFSGDAAEAFAQRLVQSCRELLARMGEQASEGRMAEAERMVDGAKSQLLRTHERIAQAEASPNADPQARAALEAARLDKLLAERSYESALATLEAARAEQAKHTQMVALAEPSRPEQATYPRRGYGILTTFFVALALFGIVRLLISAAREHAQL